MHIFNIVRELTAVISAEKTSGKRVGLVPTMGALHAGHASLVRRSVAENDVTVVSVFVNPTQFNDKNDLTNYPRTLDADVRLLEGLGVNYVFAPSAEEIYPEKDTRTFDYPPMHVMEGPRRPGHFNGVCQIVSKLFDFTKPDRAYFGEKDFQQIAVVRAMAEALSYPVEICPCPIVREESGLALSSRNALLSEEERRVAVNISRMLLLSRDYAANHSVAETHKLVVGTLNSIRELEVEYYEIVDARSLQAVTDWNEAEHIVGCITVYCGNRPVRLIDNISYK